MYNVAYVQDEKCVAQKGCRLCIMYCPEADCIRLDTKKMKAYVVINRCKGCDLCVVVCDAAKHNAIIVPECGHNDRCIFTTDLVFPAIFPK